MDYHGKLESPGFVYDRDAANSSGSEDNSPSENPRFYERSNIVFFKQEDAAFRVSPEGLCHMKSS